MSIILSDTIYGDARKRPTVSDHNLEQNYNEFWYILAHNLGRHLDIVITYFTVKFYPEKEDGDFLERTASSLLNIIFTAHHKLQMYIEIYAHLIGECILTL